MKKNYLLLVLISFLVISSELYAQVLPATCDDLVTDIPMWGDPARGVDLRTYTNSTLHWIGCPSDGCEPGQFFCEFDLTSQTLSFGTNNNDDELRAAVDPDNAEGDTMPDENLAPEGCCTAEVPLFGVCNAPDSDNNGVSIDAAEALCFALGYESGSLTEVDDNGCPEANAVTADGSDWTSDFVGSQGWGSTYTCVGFRVETPSGPIVIIPTMNQWGMIVATILLGFFAVFAIRRRTES